MGPVLEQREEDVASTASGLSEGIKRENSAQSSCYFGIRLPPWVSTNIRSPRSWKVMLRCWIACWASFVILLPNASLQTMGTASFFALLTSLFLPPYLPVQLFFFIMSTLISGLLLGWGLGVAAMRAANASRSQIILDAASQQVQASIAASPELQANPTLAQTIAIFNGEFLDIRSTAVYGSFLGFGAFVFGIMRAYAPKLLFMSVFGTIALDIFCSIGPLFPTARYTLLNSTAISISCYMAIAILTTIFIFPETMNHSCLDTISDQLERAKALVEMQDDVLLSAQDELAASSTLITKIKESRRTLVSVQQQLMAFSGFISLEFSWGRWSSDDVQSLEEPLLGIVTRVATLRSFAKLAGEPRFGLFNQQQTSDEGPNLSSPTTNDTYLLRRIHHRNTVVENTHNVRVQDILPVIHHSTKNLRLACLHGLETAKSNIDHVNKRRWRKNSDVDAQMSRALDEAVGKLSRALAAFKETERLALLDPFMNMIGTAKTREEQENLPLRSLYLAYVFGSNLISTSSAVLGFMEEVRDLVGKRKKNRLWAPSGLRRLWKLVGAKGDQTDGAAAFGEDVTVQSKGLGGVVEEKEYRRDPDSRPPTNLFQKTMHAFHGWYQWAKTPEATFTFKYVFISIALWLPGVFKASANFYYIEKGIWALIMAQTTLNIYAADQIFNLVTRLIGTAVGLALGLAAWYMGNGKGNGNPYGAAAAVGLMIIPIVFVRVFAPPQFLAGIVLACATFALVVGYSWVDGHLLQFATPGIGWSVAWRRWVLVVIGAAASSMMMMLPPTSARKAVRQRNAESITALSGVYGFLISTWISSRVNEKRDGEYVSKKDVVPAEWAREFRIMLIALAQGMQGIRELTELAKWEGSLRGAWPAEEYTKLADAQIEMIASLAQLGGALDNLEGGWRLTFLHGTKVLNPHFIADVMSAFSLISQSLSTGEPMHQVLPQTLLDRLFYHHHRNTVSGPSDNGHDAVGVEEIKSLDYMYYATGLVAVYQLLQSLDEMHKITKILCGEVPLRGFSNWRDEYERSHTSV